jgi:hypothetical protein
MTIISAKQSSNKKTIWALISGAALCLYLMGGCLQEEEKNQGVVRRELPGAKETCLGCHKNYTGFVTAHNPGTIGCSSCHLGNPFEKEEKVAHKGMVLVPGNLSNARLTCGTSGCHSEIPGRVENSLMTTMSGVITVNRFAFGESHNLSFHAHVKDLREDKPADVHLRNLCASCHLGAEKLDAARISEKSRGGGCIACHLDYSHVPKEHDIHDTTQSVRIHPAVNLKVNNKHCFGCHSRSGRISTNYEGWHETLYDPDEYAAKTGFRVLEDRRVFQFISMDVHHEKGLECIDCHDSREIMGDGKKYYHSDEAVKLRCEDCHFQTPPKVVGKDALDEESRKILRQRKMDSLYGKFMVRMGKDFPAYNIVPGKDMKPLMVGKNSGKKHPLRVPAEVCSKGKAHDALTCSACHTAWAPQCIGCHNEFDPKAKAFDLLDRRYTKGKWIEHLGGFFAALPTLGVLERNGAREIKPFIPGMIMTIDKSAFPGQKGDLPLFRRLFAPVSPHTTSATGRTCTSCHNDPNALGFGRGKLILTSQGKWKFEPEYELLPQDKLPQDAWIGFLQFPEGVVSTRPNARPFSVVEQQKILRAGACLTCHEGTSAVMTDALHDFESVSKRVGNKCIVPVW